MLINNLLVRIHVIIVMIRWTGLAPWKFVFPLPGSLTSTFLGLTPKPLGAGVETADGGPVSAQEGTSLSPPAPPSFLLHILLLLLLRRRLQFVSLGFSYRTRWSTCVRSAPPTRQVFSISLSLSFSLSLSLSLSFLPSLSRALHGGPRVRD